MKLRRTLALAGPLVLLSNATVGLSMLTLSGCNRTAPAPDVAYTLLDGRRTTLAAQRGHVLLVNFWATDCAPCIAEMPRLVETWRKFSPAGFDTLAVSMSYDPPYAVANFAQSRALPFGVAIDNTGEIAARFGDIRYTPTSMLINRRGEIVARWDGTTDLAGLQERIARLLREP